MLFNTDRAELSKNGMNELMLLSYIPDKQTELEPLPQLSTISNGLILELVDFKHQNSKCTFKTVYCWIRELYGVNWPPNSPPTCQAVTRSIERLTARLQKVKKMCSCEKKDEMLIKFLKEEFVLPNLGFHKGIKVVHHSSPPSVPQIVSGSTDSTVQVKKEMKQKMYCLNRNANKRLKRREGVIQKQGSILQTQRRKLLQYEVKLHQSERKLTKLKSKLDRVNHSASYWKGKMHVIKSHSSSKKKKLCDEIKSLKQQISLLSTDNIEMKEIIQSLMTEPKISTLEKGKYTDDVRACIYELLSLNVGVRNVAPIIRCVLNNIAHKSVSRLPSHGLICQMIVESLAVAQAQLGVELSEGGNCTTLQTDGTTKFGNHFGTFDVRVPDSKETYTLGIRHVFSGSSHDTLETLKQIMSDIDSVQSVLGKEAASSKIIFKIKNTMSDRHAAEKLFNELLHDFRAEILPSVVENWDDLTLVGKEQITHMNNFFCGLHYLVGLADCTDATIKLWEKSMATEFEESSASSGTQRLIRTACKAFHHHGSQQSGSSILFRSYLRKKNIFKIPLAKFIGNRFNIIFYDAAGIYYLHTHMINFIESVHGKQANRLLSCVLGDLKNPIYISGCRALGLIDKIVTGPFWRKLEESVSSVLEMSSTYSEIKKQFDSWAEDSSSLIEGSIRCIPDGVIHEDEVWNALIQSNSTDTMTQELLQLIFHSFSVTTQRLLIDHLPGGIHHNVTDETTIEETRSVPTTNVSPERDFAVLDRLLREKPNAHYIALEAMILFAHNKTSLWMNKLSSDERSKLLEAARTLAPSFKEKFKTRRQELLQRREEDLEKRERNNARKRLKTLKEKESLTKEIQVHGLWTSRTEVDDGLKLLANQTKKKNILKLQISFRHKVLGQTHHNKDVFKFSCQRRQHSVNQLKENLLQLIENGEDSCQFENSLSDKVVLHPKFLVGKRIRHRFQVDTELIWFNGTVVNMNDNTNEYDIQYDEEDEICSFTLLDDISSGDLMLL